MMVSNYSTLLGINLMLYCIIAVNLLWAIIAVSLKEVPALYSATCQAAIFFEKQSCSISVTLKEQYQSFPHPALEWF